MVATPLSKEQSTITPGSSKKWNPHPGASAIEVRLTDFKVVQTDNCTQYP